MQLAGSRTVFEQERQELFDEALIEQLAGGYVGTATQQASGHSP